LGIYKQAHYGRAVYLNFLINSNDFYDLDISRIGNLKLFVLTVFSKQTQQELLGH